LKELSQTRDQTDGKVKRSLPEQRLRLWPRQTRQPRFRHDLWGQLAAEAAEVGPGFGRRSWAASSSWRSCCPVSCASNPKQNYFSKWPGDVIFHRL